MKLPGFMINHLRYERPDKPQTYIEHGLFSAKHSLWMIWAALAGLVHAVFPWWFKFYTPEQVIRIYCKLAHSGRHDDLMEKYGVSKPNPTK